MAYGRADTLAEKLYTIYGQCLVRMGIKTKVRRIYIEKLISIYMKKPNQNGLKQLFLLTRMHNGDMDIDDLASLCTQDPEAATAFAWTIVRGPWEPGEAVISKSKDYAYTYARFVLKLPEDQAKIWPEKK